MGNLERGQTFKLNIYILFILVAPDSIISTFSNTINLQNTTNMKNADETDINPCQHISQITLTRVGLLPEKNLFLLQWS